MGEWVLILCMGLVTFLPRLLPMGFADKLVLPDWLKNALAFVPIAVLTAIVTQATFVRNSGLDISWGNHHAVAALVAFLIGLITRKLYLTVMAGLVCFAVLKLFFGI